MILSQFIRDNFDEITELRGSGIPWAKVEERARSLGLNPNVKSVRTLYYRETARRRSPQQVKAFSRINDNYEKIKQLRCQGCNWATVYGMLSEDSGTPLTLTMLVREFKAIDKARSSIQSGSGPLQDSASQPTAIPQTDPTPILQTEPHGATNVTPLESHTPAHKLDVSPELSDPVSPPKTPQKPRRASNRRSGASESSPDSWGSPPPRLRRQPKLPHPENTEDATPSPVTEVSANPVLLSGQDTEDLTQYAEKKAFEEQLDKILAAPKRRDPTIAIILAEEKARRDRAAEEKARREAEAEARKYHKPYHEPVFDPSISGEEYQATMSSILAERDALLPSLHAAQGDEKAALQYKVDEIYGKLHDVEADFFTRFCHRQATRSALCILSTAALSCGVFTICEEAPPDSPDKVPIRLQGYDRPDRLHGQSTPDPLFIIENYTPDDLARIAEAYETDRKEFPEFVHTGATPLRRLIEALAVRNVYIWRYQDWVEYNSYIKLEGQDFPSPTLTQSRIPYLRATSHGRSPVAEFGPVLTGDEPDREKLERWQRVDLVESRGMWLGYAI